MLAERHIVVDSLFAPLMRTVNEALVVAVFPDADLVDGVVLAYDCHCLFDRSVGVGAGKQCRKQGIQKSRGFCFFYCRLGTIIFVLPTFHIIGIEEVAVLAV